MEHSKIYADFLGIWELEVESCAYEQSEPPLDGHQIISDGPDGLVIQMSWTDRQGETYSHMFAGVPDGKARPFAGGELADALSVTLVSDTELKVSAFLKGRELMTARYLLAEGGTHLDLIQAVHLPDGSTPANVARYQRRLHS
jgi:hypothetical protein